MTELTQERRAELLDQRHRGYNAGPDFAPYDGRCYSCGDDLVAQHGDNYPTAWITGCRKCHRSYCD